MAFRPQRLRSRRAVRSAHRQARRHAARTGSARVVHPRARSRRARLLRPRDGAAPHHPGEPAEQGVLPSLVLLARHQPRAALRALRPRHGSPRTDHARLVRPCRTSSACRDTSIARRFARSADGCETRSAASASQAFEHELWLCFFAGIVRQRFRDSRAGRTTGGPHRARSMNAVPSKTGAPAIAPATAPQVDATVLICTYNRAGVPRAHARQPRDDARESRVLVERPRGRQQLERQHPRRRRCPARAVSRCRCATCSKGARESRMR